MRSHSRWGVGEAWVSKSTYIKPLLHPRCLIFIAGTINTSVLQKKTPRLRKVTETAQDLLLNVGRCRKRRLRRLILSTWWFPRSLSIKEEREGGL